MNRTILLLILVPALAACGREAAQRERPGDAGQAEHSRSDGGEGSGKPVQITVLTGLYEARMDAGRAQMCMVSAAGGAASFGIVSETGAGPGCGGAGEAVRDGNRLRLTMAGDEACVIDAQISGRDVKLPVTLPEGCSYYCGPGATLAGTVLTKTGETREDAMRAADLAGDPLCG